MTRLPLIALAAMLGLAAQPAWSQAAPGAGGLFNPGGLKAGCPFYTGAADSKNAGYLDTYAYYGVANVPLGLPDGASIRLEGRFPKNRYFSLQSYDGARTGNLVDSLPDARITPVSGVAPDPNPAALPDPAGYTNTYVVTLRYADPPANTADRAPNTLYMGAPRFTTPNRVSRQIFYRTYLPNPGSDLAGDTPPPKLYYSGPTGEIDLDQTPDAAQCERIKQVAGSLMTISPSVVASRRVRFIALGGGNGLYLNGDARYLYASFSRSYAPLVLIRSKRFAVPQLPDAVPNGIEPDIRYWSLCHYSLANGAVTGCAADRDLVAQPDGYDHLVLSTAADRPPGATPAQGYNWLDVGGNTGEEIVLRQLLPRPGFAGDYAIAAASPRASVRDTLGEWAPRITYCRRAVFDAMAASGGSALFDACYADFYPFGGP